jgi:uncharacterized protein (DUF488 family)
VEIYTIGFTKKTAAEFFGALKKAGIRRLVDIRLNNSSQLAGFTKRDDLRYFLREICDTDYAHEPNLAPTEAMLKSIQSKEVSWDEYERGFRALLVERAVEDKIERGTFSIPTVLLCSEPTAEKCHRRLVAEYLKEKWGDIEIRHL